MPLQHLAMLIPPSCPHLSSPTPLSPLPPIMWKVEEKVQCQFSVQVFRAGVWAGGREASIQTMQLDILLPLLCRLMRKCTTSCVKSRSLSWWGRGLHLTRAAPHPPPFPWQVEEKVHLQFAEHHGVQSRSPSWWGRGLHPPCAALHPPPSPWQVEEKVHRQICTEPESELVGEVV